MDYLLFLGLFFFWIFVKIIFFLNGLFGFFLYFFFLIKSFEYQKKLQDTIAQKHINTNILFDFTSNDLQQMILDKRRSTKSNNLFFLDLK